MGAGGSSEAVVPGGPAVAGAEPGAAGAAGGGAQWGAFVVLLFLGLLVAYCCWGAPCCRGCCCRPRKNPAPAAHPRDREDTTGGGQPEDALGAVCTPTIILLPQGRMLVVDGAVLSSLQADASGLDLIRLGENLVRAQRRQDSSILDAESGLAGLAGLAALVGRKDSQGLRLLDGGPPTYDELFGEEHELASPGTTSGASLAPPCSPGRPALGGASRELGSSPLLPCPVPARRSHATSGVVHPPTYEELLDQAQATHRLFPGPAPSTPSSPSSAVCPGPDTPPTAAIPPVGDGRTDGDVETPPPVRAQTDRTVSPSGGDDGDQGIKESRV